MKFVGPNIWVSQRTFTLANMITSYSVLAQVKRVGFSQTLNLSPLLQFVWEFISLNWLDHLHDLIIFANIRSLSVQWCLTTKHTWCVLKFLIRRFIKSLFVMRNSIPDVFLRRRPLKIQWHVIAKPSELPFILPIWRKLAKTSYFYDIIFLNSKWEYWLK